MDRQDMRETRTKELENFEQRLRYLENSHGLVGVSDPMLRCDAAAAIDKKVEKLAEEGYNHLEERMHELKKRVDSIEEHEAWVRTATHAYQRDESTWRKFHVAPLEARLSRYESLLKSTSHRLLQLEAGPRSTFSISALSTNDLAQTLFDRLKKGERLNPTLLAQLMDVQNIEAEGVTCTAHSSNTTSPADTSSDQPSNDIETIEDLPIRRGRVRHYQHGHDARKAATTANLSVEGSPRKSNPSVSSLKRGRCRPRNHDRSAHRVDGASRSDSKGPGKDTKDPTLAPKDTYMTNIDRVGSGSSVHPPSCTPSRLTEKDPIEMQQMTDEDDVEMQEDVVIPPERKSRRTPKPTKKFGDVVSWKEANKKMRGLGQLTPYSPCRR